MEFDGFRQLILRPTTITYNHIPAVQTVQLDESFVNKLTIPMQPVYASRQ